MIRGIETCTSKLQTELYTLIKNNPGISQPDINKYFVNAGRYAKNKSCSAISQALARIKMQKLIYFETTFNSVRGSIPKKLWYVVIDRPNIIGESQ